MSSKNLLTSIILPLLAVSLVAGNVYARPRPPAASPDLRQSTIELCGMVAEQAASYAVIRDQGVRYDVAMRGMERTIRTTMPPTDAVNPVVQMALRLSNEMLTTAYMRPELTAAQLGKAGAEECALRMVDMYPQLVETPQARTLGRQEPRGTSRY